MSKETDLKEYLIMLSGKTEDWEAQSENRKKEVMAMYKDWVGSLKEKGIFEYGAALGREVARMSGSIGSIKVDGPYTESKENLTGYFVIKAESHEQAVEIAKGCPAFSHGDDVQVHDQY